MVVQEAINQLLGLRSLNEADSFVAEMANFLADTTELPANIVLWTRPQPSELPHNKYRMKVYKDRIHVATLTIASNPTLVWEIGRKKLKLDQYESEQASTVIADFASLFIQYVDAVLTADDVKQLIKKAHGI